MVRGERGGGVKSGRFPLLLAVGQRWAAHNLVIVWSPRPAHRGSRRATWWPRGEREPGTTASQKQSAICNLQSAVGGRRHNPLLHSSTPLSVLPTAWERRRHRGHRGHRGHRSEVTGHSRRSASDIYLSSETCIAESPLARGLTQKNGLLPQADDDERTCVERSQTCIAARAGFVVATEPRSPSARLGCNNNVIIRCMEMDEEHATESTVLPHAPHLCILVG